MIQSIQGTNDALNRIKEKQNQIAGTNDDAFTSAFNMAKELLEVTNQAEQLTTQLTYDFMTGKNENIHGLMVAQEKSSILLQFTMQVRNNVLEAYREIMRMSV